MNGLPARRRARVTALRLVATPDEIVEHRPPHRVVMPYWQFPTLSQQIAQEHRAARQHLGRQRVEQRAREITLTLDMQQEAADTMDRLFRAESGA